MSLQNLIFSVLISTQAQAAVISLDQFPPNQPTSLYEIGEQPYPVFLKALIGASNSFEYTNPIKQMLARLNDFNRPYGNTRYSVESQNALIEVLGKLTKRALINQAHAIKSGSTRSNAYLLGSESYLNVLAEPIPTRKQNEFDNIFLLLAEKLLKDPQLATSLRSEIKSVMDTLTEIALMYKELVKHESASTEHVMLSIGTLARIVRVNSQTEVGQLAIQALKTIITDSPDGYFGSNSGGVVDRKPAPWNLASKALTDLALEIEGRKAGIACADLLLGGG